MPASRFDDPSLKWVRLEGPDNGPSHPVDYSLALLGADPESGSIDFLMKLPPGGHCTFHRHVGKTTTYVLEGEHHLFEPGADGEMQVEVRRVGGHAVSPGGHRHIEGTGADGGLILFSVQAVDGHVFDLLDPDGAIVQKVTYDDLVAALR